MPDSSLDESDAPGLRFRGVALLELFARDPPAKAVDVCPCEATVRLSGELVASMLSVGVLSPLMALFHRATLTPSKEALISDWVPRQPWGPGDGTPIELIGSYRFDDPEGAVGMETFIGIAAESLLQIPLTYRDAPLDDADGGLICMMDHSVLGTRWVYDGLRDPRFVAMLAAGAMTGQGEALGMAVYEGRWHVAPTNVRVRGGGWTLDRVPVDGFVMTGQDDTRAILANDLFELTVYRRPERGAQPPIGLTATWIGQPDPVVLAEITAHSA